MILPNIEKSIYICSYLYLLTVLKDNDYHIIEENDKIVLNRKLSIILSIDKIEIEKIVQESNHITYSFNKVIYNMYKNSTKPFYQSKANKAKNTMNIIIYIYSIKYLCSELNKTIKIFNLS